VRCGGAINHRCGLNDAAMLKENHLAWTRGVARAVAAVSSAAPWPARVIVEEESAHEAAQAVDASAEGVLLDGFTPGALLELVPHLRRQANGRGMPVVLED
jgi:nicotinate-nucleotide pyrophosphorylase (carboxylating)